VLAFYRDRGSAEEGWPGGGNSGINVFNAIQDGEVKGRVKEGVLMAGRVKAQGSHSRRGAGRREVVGRAGFGGGRREVGGGADSRGPHDRERRERMRPAQKARTKKENVFLRRRYRYTGQMGRRGRFRPVGEGRPAGLAGPKAKWASKARRAESGK
jgi:hypothetical protein